MILRFPFITISADDLARPYIPVRISNPATDSSLRVFALIDSGADECALPASFAAILGHHLEMGAVKQVSTGNGATNAFSHTTVISVGAFSTGPILVDYMPNLYVPLLGARSFLRPFVLTLDYPKQETTLDLSSTMAGTGL